MSRFASLKKVETETQDKKFHKNIVVGFDLFTVAQYRKLIKDEASTVLISEKEISKRSLQLRGPSMLRGQENIDLFNKMYPEIETTINEGPFLFYKEKEWRSFGGRSKPETLINGEEFFTLKNAAFDLEKIFPFINDEEFFQKLNENLLQGHIKSIEKLEGPYDLAEPAHFKVKLASGEILLCEKLFWGEGPEQYLSKYSNPGQLSTEFIEFCEETRSPGTLTVCFKMNKSLIAKGATHFIPLSYTHEWGHFIGEEKLINDEVWFEFLTFIDSEQTSEQDLVKKIHLLKRHLEKIFENFNKFVLDEYVSFNPSSPCLKIDDSKVEGSLDEKQRLFFVSYNAPLDQSCPDEFSFDYSTSALSFLSRALKSIHHR